MAKKNKRQVSKETLLSPSPAVESAASNGRSVRTAERDAGPDYSYVASDLRRIGVIAGGLLVVLVVLSFII
jgi:hypothetical protein